MSEHKPQGPPLAEAELMQLMAFADGELQDDPSAAAEVQALIDRSPQASVLVNDLRLASRALQEDVLASERAAMPDALADLSAHVIADLEAMELMAFADGELADDADATARVQALIASSADARNAVHDLRVARRALHEEVTRSESEEDMSMVRGRIMTRLPVQPRPAAEASPEASESWLIRLRTLLLGRPGLVLGLGLAALLLALALGRVQDQAPVDGPLAPVGPMATVDEPAVIIEEMEIDSGTVLVDGGEEPGSVTIIWHYPDEEDEGAG